MDLVNYEKPLAQAGSSPCPNAPNPCYCTGKCTINEVYGVNMQRQAPPTAQPISAAHAAKIKEIRERVLPVKPVFVMEHNAEEDVARPAHYNRTSISALQVIDSWGLNFRMGNAIKYIQRCLAKGTPVEDLTKAITYLELEKQRLLDAVILNHPIA